MDAATVDTPSQPPATGVVCLNVGGCEYWTTISTLTSASESMLARMFSGTLPVAKDSKGRYFIDRPGEPFVQVLSWLRGLPLPKTLDGEALDALVREAEFYQLHGLRSAVDELRLLAARRPAKVQYLWVQGYDAEPAAPPARTPSPHRSTYTCDRCRYDYHYDDAGEGCPVCWYYRYGDGLVRLRASPLRMTFAAKMDYLLRACWVPVLTQALEDGEVGAFMRRKIKPGDES